MPRVARLHVSGAKQLVGPPLELAVPRPHLDQPRLQLLGQLAKPVQAVGARAVEGADQDQAMVEALRGLVEQEGGLLGPPLPCGVARDLQEAGGAIEPLLIIVLGLA